MIKAQFLAATPTTLAWALPQKLGRIELAILNYQSARGLVSADGEDVARGEGVVLGEGETLGEGDGVTSEPGEG
jgi:hypothetical protein